MKLQPTSSQTVGPFFDIGLRRFCCADLLVPGLSGSRITIEGRVLDGNGLPVPDAVVEVWQANAHGKYAHPEDTQDKPLESAFKGYGRIATDDQGRFRITTIKPGPVPGPRGTNQAPHLEISVFMRGLLKRLVTRIYFPDDPRNGADPVLALVAPERRGTLIAKAAPGQPDRLAWDVVLQGAGETVFFDC
ncbi:MAG: protocatechuate 3,4-dioxygenase subunit alpha [Acidobacteria bacterium]|nr:MAG: protocatechuate 3,4-dioxygenase subunit alpha [Acidobacteriota bacterium]